VELRSYVNTHTHTHTHTLYSVDEFLIFKKSVTILLPASYNAFIVTFEHFVLGTHNISVYASSVYFVSYNLFHILLSFELNSGSVECIIICIYVPMCGCMHM
jgi:hypothetical protein